MGWWKGDFFLGGLGDLTNSLKDKENAYLAMVLAMVCAG